MVKFDCPKCGGQLEQRAPGAALVIVCGQCGSVLDAKDPRHKQLAQYEAAVKNAKPDIPIGKRGKFDGIDFEVIGYLRRRVQYYGVDYYWSEYLLYNPYKGFRWLVESDEGHWALLENMANAPKGQK